MWECPPWEAERRTVGYQPRSLLVAQRASPRCPAGTRDVFPPSAVPGPSRRAVEVATRPCMLCGRSGGLGGAAARSLGATLARGAARWLRVSRLTVACCRRRCLGPSRACACASTTGGWERRRCRPVSLACCQGARAPDAEQAHRSSIRPDGPGRALRTRRLTVHIGLSADLARRLGRLFCLALRRVCGRCSGRAGMGARFVSSDRARDSRPAPCRCAQGASS